MIINVRKEMIKMRIIDKQHDYYDYLQDVTDTIVFDRRGSINLDKDTVRLHLNEMGTNKSKYRFLLFQCGSTYWLILAEGIFDRYIYDYKLTLLNSWKNYKKTLEFFKLDVISFNNNFLYAKNSVGKDYEYDKIINNVDKICNMIDLNNYIEKSHICNSIRKIYDYKTKTCKYEFHVPLLKTSGLISVIDPMQLFLSIEEYYSLLKTKSERIEPIGVTNNDKIIMHGFDTKISFRN